MHVRKTGLSRCVCEIVSPLTGEYSMILLKQMYCSSLHSFTSYSFVIDSTQAAVRTARLMQGWPQPEGTPQAGTDEHAPTSTQTRQGSANVRQRPLLRVRRLHQLYVRNDQHPAIKRVVRHTRKSTYDTSEAAAPQFGNNSAGGTGGSPPDTCAHALSLGQLLQACVPTHSLVDIRTVTSLRVHRLCTTSL